jgi:tetratricopeptide (TPR) repeat protein
MKIRLFVQIGIVLAVGVGVLYNAAAQDINNINQQMHQEWDGKQATYFTSPSAPSPAAPAVPTPQQQMQLQGAQMLGNAVGQAIGQALFGSPQSDAQQQAQQLAQQAQQQRMLAAQQLNNSGIYLFRQRDYTGAINVFEKALAQTPGDQVIINNIAQAKQKMKDTAVAAQNSDELRQLLGDTPPDDGKIDFDQLTHSQVQSPNESALNLVNLNDTSTVDLRDATKTSVDPASLKSQLDQVFANGAPASAPSDSHVVPPEVKDIELLFDAVPKSNISDKPMTDEEIPDDADLKTYAQTNGNVHTLEAWHRFIEKKYPTIDPSKVPKDSDIQFLFSGLPATQREQ